MPIQSSAGFDVDAFLSSAGPGRKIVTLKAKQVFFSQGDSAESIFYMQRGRIKISVASASGKEAAIRLVSNGEFFGEDAMANEEHLYGTTATAMIDCIALRIARAEFLRVMREEPRFSNLFSLFLLACSLRLQADLVDQLFNGAERRLARLLLLLAGPETPGEENTLIPSISQETLAQMIGSTRPRVNVFMNRFRDLGMIQYNGRIRVHRPLLSVFLRDEQGSVSPSVRR